MNIIKSINKYADITSSKLGEQIGDERLTRSSARLSSIPVAQRTKSEKAAKESSSRETAKKNIESKLSKERKAAERNIMEKEDQVFSKLYIRLITEEFIELITDIAQEEPEIIDLIKSLEKVLYEIIEIKKPNFDLQDKVNIADDLSDIIYTCNGLANVLGINLDKVNEEVHSSNMSKLNPDTGFADKDSNGKVIKGRGYFKPNIPNVLGISL